MTTDKILSLNWGREKHVTKNATENYVHEQTENKSAFGGDWLKDDPDYGCY